MLYEVITDPQYSVRNAGDLYVILRTLFIFFIFFSGQVLMANTTVEHVDVNGVSVPMIFERDTRLPIVSMRNNFV